ncbi:hypothetical protein BJX99DRAFT_67922 [Aspergillus californicus]
MLISIPTYQHVCVLTQGESPFFTFLHFQLYLLAITESPLCHFLISAFLHLRFGFCLRLRLYIRYQIMHGFT